MSDSTKIPEGFTYAQESLEGIPCNLCGANDADVVGVHASNGYKATTRLCKRCGLIYISPRMTREGYDRYYHYFYREDRERAKGFADDEERYLEKNFGAARRFGVALAGRTRAHLIEKGRTLDVGSSTGGVLQGIKDIFPEMEIQGVEPSVAESGYANAHGVPTETAIFENYRTRRSEPWSNIVCVRSLNHLLDPKGFFEWCFGNLVPGGSLLLEVKNFRFQARRAGSVEAGVQIDHPFMFIPETLSAMVGAAGFTLAYIDDDEKKTSAERNVQRSEGLSRHHVRLVARKPKTEGEIRSPIDPVRAARIRKQLTNPRLKLHYLFHYGRHIAPLRKLLGA